MRGGVSLIRLVTRRGVLGKPCKRRGIPGKGRGIHGKTCKVSKSY